MNTINRLGLIVAGITVAIITVGYISYLGVSKLLVKNDPISQPSPQPQSVEEIVDSSKDSDSDGLPDLVENLYRTDPNKTDTDEDGTNDGDEIALGRDPAKKGPDDKSQDIITGLETVPTDTYTKKYLSTLPANLPRENVIEKERLEAFIEQEKGVLLPQVTVKTTKDSGKEAIQTYLEAISANNPDITAISSTDIENAYRDYYSTPKTSTDLPNILESLKKNASVLANIQVPAEAKALHEKLLAASQALAGNTELLINITNDFVGSLIGAKNIELLGPIFNSIAEDVVALEKKYQLN